MSAPALATFVDRYTMRHVRVFPHSIERVWDAITDDAQVSRWMGFPVVLDLRVGGRCVWGPPKRVYFETEIARLEPTTRIEHAGVPPSGDGYMLFELAPHADGTRFDFTHRFDPSGSWDEVPDDLGGDLPGGADTPWRPGFVGGFHVMFDMLGNLLDGAPLDRGQAPEDELFGRLVDAWLDRKVGEGELDQAVADRYRVELRLTARWNDLNQIYRQHIRDTIPKEGA
jgi:uncharacterized protein YndB with AHSA1/START domain